MKKENIEILKDTLRILNQGSYSNASWLLSYHIRSLVQLAKRIPD